MLQAVIYYIVIVILTKELVIANDQCTEYQFKTPFFPGVSCEDIYNRNPQSHDKAGYCWILDGPSRVYCAMNYTGSSCEDIYNNNPETHDKSGYYRINDSQWTYCNMTTIAIAAGDFILTCAGVGGGWRRIVSINISAGDDCPGEWRKATQSGVSFCRVAINDSNFLCSSASFSTNGTNYQRVCGRARGYQKGDTLAFYGAHDFNHGIDQSYVSGLSITHGSNPRQHIQTFASGRGEKRTDVFNCRCTRTDAFVPSYVGSNYYCESANWYGHHFDTYFFNDTLWDGAGCIDNCCDDATQPWFYRELSQITQDDIEARICSYGYFVHRSTLIDQLELYIQ